MIRRLLSLVIYTQTTLIGLVAFLYPFWLPAIHQSGAAGAGSAHADDAPLMLTLLVGLCFAVLLLEVQGQTISTKTIALLGILVAINAALRFISVAIPGPGGFSPIFFLIALTGYVFGARFGFLMGALTLLVSALITGGVGPWLPYQMFTAGWMGLSMPLCRPLVWLLPKNGRWGQAGWGEILILAAFAGLWGLGYGMIMNIWFWPFANGAADQSWAPGMSFATTLQHYSVFYVATSRFWDMLRLLGNVVLIGAFGLPTLRVLRRFQQRFTFVYQPLPAGSTESLADKRTIDAPPMRAGSIL